MKRLALSLAVGLLLVGLVPGAALANVPVPAANLDQSNNTQVFDANTFGEGAYYGFAQTFTVGKTGMLSGVDLYMSQSGSSSLTVRIDSLGGSGRPDGNDYAHGSATVGAAAWYHFGFISPFAVTIGQIYVIVCGTCADAIPQGTSADSYTGGYAMIDDNQPPNDTGWSWGIGFPAVADFAFRTHVDQVTTTLSWNKTSVPAGVSTALTLTETFTFSNGGEGHLYGIALGGASLGGLPAWFTLATIVCTYQDDSNTPYTYTGPPNCPVSGTFETTIEPDDSGNLGTLTIVVTGTAHPAAGDHGTVAQTGGESCLGYAATDVVHPNQPGPNCAIGSTSVGVGVVPAPTAPPTTTDAGRSSGNPDGIIWFLPIGLVAFVGALVFATRRRRQVR